MKYDKVRVATGLEWSGPDWSGPWTGVDQSGLWIGSEWINRLARVQE